MGFDSINVASIMKKKSIETRRDLSFAELTTLGVGGKIKLAVYPDTVSKLIFALRWLSKNNVEYVVLGKGSNTLASDEPYDGVVVSTLNLKAVKIKGKNVVAQAGASTVTLAKQLQSRGLTGGEFFACLPASVGGAVICNAGCFNQDVKSVVTSVTALYRGKVRKIPAGKCNFCKRGSIFKNNGDYVVLSASFKFDNSTPDAVADSIANMRLRKSATQPLNYRSAGCVLYHDKVAVSRLIDEANLKGYRIGGAEISLKHAGFVVNVDKAKSKDIYLIIRHVRNTLYERYGVTAKVEVCLINFTKDERYDLFAGS